ncbi:PREDICTED: reticulon-like protein B12 isoform X1 [Erythranthe guttata]|uniref:reticulon-like protein B12 isoform X1 n=1 Tax=Erythranthe guttata TaxID=4155 RepID=UPI00064DBDDC|nr:PREDICTED: reticulon-like protein B12 isoform X1 [Erythranthe guttata]|eukprot:XP_012832099.1 PREDICTED: reticulon-like protein B12 isoform X1 [Erythranthe guttata]
MGSSEKLSNRGREIHQILGGGLAVADVILWRQKNLTVGILVVALAVWVVFEISGYTLLSLFSSVFFLLFTILFLWAKSAAILNRPAPPLPHFHLSEETVNEAANTIRGHINVVLSVSEDIAHGRDSRMFVKVAISLLMISVIGSLTDFFTLCYTCLVIVLTVPALCERYKDCICRYGQVWHRKLQHVYVRFDEECVTKVHKWILETKKLN